MPTLDDHPDCVNFCAHAMRWRLDPPAPPVDLLTLDDAETFVHAEALTIEVEALVATLREALAVIQRGDVQRRRMALRIDQLVAELRAARAEARHFAAQLRAVQAA